MHCGQQFGFRLLCWGVAGRVAALHCAPLLFCTIALDLCASAVPPAISPLPPPAAQVLWLHDCLAIWRSVHFLGHIAMLAIILLGNVVPPRRMRRDLQPEKAGLRGGGAPAGDKGAAAAAVAPGAVGDGVAAAAAGSQEEKKEL